MIYEGLAVMNRVHVDVFLLLDVELDKTDANGQHHPIEMHGASVSLNKQTHFRVNLHPGVSADRVHAHGDPGLEKATTMEYLRKNVPRSTR